MGINITNVVSRVANWQWWLNNDGSVMMIEKQLDDSSWMVHWWCWLDNISVLMAIDGNPMIAVGSWFNNDCHEVVQWWRSRGIPVMAIEQWSTDNNQRYSNNETWELVWQLWLGNGPTMAVKQWFGDDGTDVVQHCRLSGSTKMVAGWQSYDNGRLQISDSSRAVVWQ